MKIKRFLKRSLTVLTAASMLISSSAFASGFATVPKQTSQVDVFYDFADFVKAKGEVSDTYTGDVWNAGLSKNTLLPEGLAPYAYVPTHESALSSKDISGSNALSFGGVSDKPGVMYHFDEMISQGKINVSFDLFYNYNSAADAKNDTFFVEFINKSAGSVEDTYAMTYNGGTRTPVLSWNYYRAEGEKIIEFAGTDLVAIGNGKCLDLSQVTASKPLSSIGNWHKYNIIYDLDNATYRAFIDGVELEPTTQPKFDSRDKMVRAIHFYSHTDVSTSDEAIAIDNLRINHTPTGEEMSAPEIHIEKMPAPADKNVIINLTETPVDNEEPVNSSTLFDYIAVKDSSGETITHASLETTDWGAYKINFSTPLAEGKYTVAIEELKGSVSDKLYGNAVFYVRDSKTDLKSGKTYLDTTETIAPSTTPMVYEFSSAITQGKTKIEFDIKSDETAEFNIGLLGDADFPDENYKVARLDSANKWQKWITQDDSFKKTLLGGKENKLYALVHSDFPDKDISPAATEVAALSADWTKVTVNLDFDTRTYTVQYGEEGTTSDAKSFEHLNRQYVSIHEDTIKADTAATPKETVDDVEYDTIAETPTGVVVRNEWHNVKEGSTTVAKPKTKYLIKYNNGIKGLWFGNGAQYKNIKVTEEATEKYNLNMTFDNVNLSHITGTSNNGNVKNNSVIWSYSQNTTNGFSIVGKSDTDADKALQVKRTSTTKDEFSIPFNTPVKAGHDFTIEFDYKPDGANETVKEKQEQSDGTFKEVTTYSSNNNRFILGLEGEDYQTYYTHPAIRKDMIFGIGLKSIIEPVTETNYNSKKTYSSVDTYLFSTDSWYHIKIDVNPEGNKTYYELTITKDDGAAFAPNPEAKYNNKTAHTGKYSIERAPKDYYSLSFGGYEGNNETGYKIDNVKVYENTAELTDVTVEDYFATNFDGSKTEVDTSITTETDYIDVMITGKVTNPNIVKVTDGTGVEIAGVTKSMTDGGKAIRIKFNKLLEAGQTIILSKDNAESADSYLSTTNMNNKVLKVTQGTQAISVDDYRIYKYNEEFTHTPTAFSELLTYPAKWLPVMDSSLSNYNKEEQFSVIVSGVNTYAEPLNATMIMATYDESKTLINAVDNYNTEINTGEFNIQFGSVAESSTLKTIDSNLLDASKYVKFFIMLNDGTIRPITGYLGYETWYKAE